MVEINSVGEDEAERMGAFCRMALDSAFSNEFLGNVVRANLDLFERFAAFGAPTTTSHMDPITPKGEEA